MTHQLRYYEAVEQLQLGRRLQQWNWQLVGSPPLGIDIVNAEIDVVCSFSEPAIFAETVWNEFGAAGEFRIWQRTTKERPVVARFSAFGREVEIYGSSVPLRQQLAVRHYEIERRLLCLGGDRLRTSVRRMKQRGIKTEQAFTMSLNLTGDPYEALLRLEDVSDSQLTDLIAEAGLAEDSH
ncbi:DUF4269 domain-containing protein [Sinorhizobium meliloti]|uniref:DUF4269 domain-containing protein n=1 Tax=Rhizobium meliloti TaxID=382 RepID=UPI00209164FA|nr:DUF4269 domain-containing protein [Sinorhizobium meliloti]MCO5965407.1 DUF4269 domain-containing protein [Sinorhizobium meliloti]